MYFSLYGAPFIFLVNSFLPVSFAIAIFRNRLWEIDVLINRTLVYGPLTAVVAGTYIAAVQLFKSLFILFTGEPSDTAIVMATLTVAAVFWILRMRLQAFVDRRFKEAPDPAKELKAFSDRVRLVSDVVDASAIRVEHLARHLLDHATDAFDAEGARSTCIGTASQSPSRQMADGTKMPASAYLSITTAGRWVVLSWGHDAPAQRTHGITAKLWRAARPLSQR